MKYWFHTILTRVMYDVYMTLYNDANNGKINWVSYGHDLLFNLVRQV